MKKKNYYYVIVYHANKLKFVTSIDRETKTAKWEMKQDAKPYEFGNLDDAQYVCLGLQFNCGLWAYPVHMNYELTTLPYYEKEDK